jgi:hypothetical protein
LIALIKNHTDLGLFKFDLAKPSVDRDQGKHGEILAIYVNQNHELLAR